MKNFIVTGGAGFIGTNLCRFLIEKGHNVVSIDNYSLGKKSNHVNGVNYVEGDTNNIKSIILDNNIKNIDGIFHLGEYSKIASSFDEYENVFDSNIKGTTEVIKFCIDKKIKLVYAASSTKFAEEGIDHSPYSCTKSQNVSLIKKEIIRMLVIQLMEYIKVIFIMKMTNFN
jgi:UDP-glucose 4-epimerase